MKTDMEPTGAEARDFESFFQREYEQLFRAIVLASGNTQDAEDLAQEAMARLLERWDRLDHVDSKHSYLYAVAFNLLRRRRRRDAMFMRFVRSSRVDLSTEGPEGFHAVLASISELPPGQRDAVVLVEWLGLTSVEAAEVLHIKPVSVRGRIHQARERLQSDLGIEVSRDE